MSRTINPMTRWKRAWGRRLWMLLLLIGGVCTLFLLAGCSEGKRTDGLVVYSAGPRELVEFLCKEFERESGIRTQFFCATTGEVMAKLQAEEFRPQADVVVLAGQTAAEVLKQQGTLAPLPTGDYLKMHPQWNDPAGYYASTSACALGVALRRDQYDPNWDWDDIWKGVLRGDLIMPSPSQSGSSAEFVVNFHLASGKRF